MRKKKLIFGILIIVFISYFFIKMYPFSKGITEDIQTINKKDSVLIINTNEFKKDVKSRNRINLKEELKLQYGGEFMVAYHSGKKILSLLNYKNLFNPFIKTLDKSLVDFNISKDENSDVFYSKNNSKITIYSYKNEMYGNTEYEVVGNLFEENITLTNNIKIGMLKIDFLNKFFELGNEIAYEINQVSISEDERGETHTKYKFESGKLIGISFGDNDEFSIMEIKK